MVLICNILNLAFSFFLDCDVSYIVQIFSCFEKLQFVTVQIIPLIVLSPKKLINLGA
jgi:hypothetical protein